MEGVEEEEKPYYTGKLYFTYNSVLLKNKKLLINYSKTFKVFLRLKMQGLGLHKHLSQLQKKNENPKTTAPSGHSSVSKFKPPMNPLEMEQGSHKMMPGAKWKKGYTKMLRDKKMDHLFSDEHVYTPEFRGDTKDIKKDVWTWGALIDEMNEFDEEKDADAHQAFISEFTCWLMGKSRWNHPNITPWGYQRLVGDSIQEFIKEFVMKKVDFALELQKLKADPQPPITIADAWIYWKFLVTPLDLKKAEKGLNYNDAKNPPPDFSYDQGFLPDLEYWLKIRQDASYAKRASENKRFHFPENLPKTEPSLVDERDPSSGALRIRKTKPLSVIPSIRNPSQSGRNSTVPHGDLGVVCDVDHPGGKFENPDLAEYQREELEEDNLREELALLKREKEIEQGFINPTPEVLDPLRFEKKSTSEYDLGEKYVINFNRLSKEDEEFFKAILDETKNPATLYKRISEMKGDVASSMIQFMIPKDYGELKAEIKKYFEENKEITLADFNWIKALPEEGRREFADILHRTKQLMVNQDENRAPGVKRRPSAYFFNALISGLQSGDRTSSDVAMPYDPFQISEEDKLKEYTDVMEIGELDPRADVSMTQEEEEKKIQDEILEIQKAKDKRQKKIVQLRLENEAEDVKMKIIQTRAEKIEKQLGEVINKGDKMEEVPLSAFPSNKQEEGSEFTRKYNQYLRDYPGSKQGDPSNAGASSSSFMGEVVGNKVNLVAPKKENIIHINQLPTYASPSHIPLPNPLPAEKRESRRRKDIH